MDFFDSSGAVVLLQNLEVLVTDIDGGGQAERAQFAGIASYTVSDPTSLTVEPSGTPAAEDETGVRVFKGTETSGIATRRDVAVLFAEASSIGLRAFSEGSGGVVGFAFGPRTWGVATQTTPVGSGTYTITYDLNGGAPAEGLPDPTTGAGDLTLAMGTGLSKDGINISSWNTVANGTGVRFPLGATYRPISNITLFAQYETQRVTFNGNGSDGGSMSPQDAAGPTELTPNGFTKTGERFTGWNTAADGSGTPYSDGGIFPFSANRTLYAQWTRELICGALTSFDEDDFRVIGDANVSGSRITLTPDLTGQAGGFWSLGRVNLNSDFCVSAEVYLGSNDAGADGLAFVLQSVNSNSLTEGGGLGYAGLNPSFAVEIDTYPNTGDPAGDHIALMKNGNATVHNSWGVEPVSLSNVEDGNWRLLTLEWDASAKTTTVYLDETARFSSASTDLVDYFSSSNGTVFWGFTAATGGAKNLQEARNVLYSATFRTNAAPQFVNPPTNRTILRASENELTVGLSDDATTQGQWDLDIQVSNSDIFATPPTFEVTSATSALLTLEGHPTELGSTDITLTATDADGSTVSRTFTITVATSLPAPPAADPTPRPRAPIAENAAPLPSAGPVVPPGRTTPAAPPVIPPTQSGPVLTGGTPPTPPNQPVAKSGNTEVPVNTQVVSPDRLDIRAGTVSLGVSVPETVGGVRQTGGTTTELEVRSGGQTTLQGAGVLPGSTVQVFLPLQGSNAKELAQIQSDENGVFNGEALFATQRTESPLPVGRQVLQIVSLDENGEQMVMELTVNIAQPPPAPEFDRSVDALPQLPPGQSIATEAGLPVAVQVRAETDNRQAVIEANGWTMAIAVAGQDASVEETPEGGASLTFVRDETASVQGAGFMPGTRADVWLFSEPTLLGTVTIDDNGEFNGEISVDGRVVTVGEHTLQLQGVGADGYVRSANLGVMVKDTELTTSSETGAGFTGWLWVIALIALVLLVAITVWLTRRSRENYS